MEIKTITVEAGYCFGDEPLRLSDLAKVNFIFAPNGAGKTTISNELAKQPSDPVERSAWGVAPTDLPIRVFNEKYRSTVLTEHVGGIFTMGEESEEINAAIQTLKNAKKKRVEQRESWARDIGSDEDPRQISGLLGTVHDERNTARKAVFEAHKKHPSAAVQIVFKGFRNDKAKFLDEALRRTSVGIDSPAGTTWDSLEQRATSLDGGKDTRQRLPGIATTSLVSTEDIEFIGDGPSTVGTGEFSSLIEHLGNEDWVNEGREYVDDAGEKCPFCQQQAPPDLVAKLAEHFAGGFDSALMRANALDDRVSAGANALETELKALESAVGLDSEVDVGSFAAALLNLRTAAELLLSKAREKRAHPTRAIKVEDISEPLVALAALIQAENLTIDQHNDVVNNAATERTKIVDDGWALFLSDAVVSSALKRFDGILHKSLSRIAILREKIVESSQADAQDDLEIGRLRTSISNTAEVAERINKLLVLMGFHRFHLEVANEVTGGYRIVRQDGTSAVETLSEGEKSFICFAYFWESLSGSATSGGSPEEVVVVVDDPISSLDSDSLFIVAAYLRDAAKEAVEGRSNVRQLIVLTHNTQFHHEAAFTTNRPNAQQRHYFRLLKHYDGHTVALDDLNKNRIRGTYPLLWQAIVEAAGTTEESDLLQVGVVNITRRIIEGYFRIIGNVQDHARPEGLSALDQRVISMFHMWASAGSHTIADDIDQTLDIGSVARFLLLFQHYFDLVGHASHFEMMVRGSGGAALLEPGGVFAQQGLEPGVG